MNQYKLQFVWQVDNDIADILQWYENQQIGLADRFLTNYFLAIDTLASNPLAYQIKQNNIRSVQVKQFPYLVYYQIYEQTVLIIAVFHGKKDPVNTFSEISNRH